MPEQVFELQEIKSLANRLLDITHPIVVGPNTYSSPIFASIVEAAFRRDYLTLSTIRKLSEGTQMELTVSGSSCMDLSRRVLEDMISLEYMIMKGKDKMAKKFRNYLFVEDKRIMDYLEDGGVIIESSRKSEINKNYDNVKKDFLDKSSRTRWKAWKEIIDYLQKNNVEISNELHKQIEEEFIKRYPDSSEKTRRSWAGLDVEEMILELHRNSIIPSSDELKSILATYRVGNSKNHFSPTDLMNYHHEELFETSNLSDVKLSLLLVTMYLTRIASITFDELEFSNKSQIKDGVNAIWNEILTAHQTVG